MTDLAVDWALVIAALLGGSGITGGILTYLQLRQQRKLEAIRVLREFVFKPEVLKIYAADLDLVQINEAFMELKAGKRLVTVNLPETGGCFVRIKSEKQLLSLFLKFLDRLSNESYEVSRSGLFLLVPTRVKKKAGDIKRTLDTCKTLDDMERAHKAIDEYGNELKKVLGLDIFE